MEWVLLLLAGGGAGAYATRRVLAFRSDRRERAVQVDQVRQIAEEDVTVFGEQLQRLGDTVADQTLDQRTQTDYQAALDAYERAKWDAPRIDDPDQISALVDTLATGRYALACVHARLAGKPLPEHRVSCFFNPQHGPSAHDVMWTSPRHGTKKVPACRRCSTQLAARQKPEVRKVQIGARRVPYWEAGATLHPYSRGYFPSDIGAAGYAMAWVYTAPELGHVPPGSHGGGLEPGAYGGGFDLGGMDGGGGAD